MTTAGRPRPSPRLPLKGEPEEPEDDEDRDPLPISRLLMGDQMLWMPLLPPSFTSDAHPDPDPSPEREPMPKVPADAEKDEDEEAAAAAEAAGVQYFLVWMLRRRFVSWSTVTLRSPTRRDRLSRWDRRTDG